MPITYVPARNTVLLSLLLGLAEVVEADQLFIGANAVDYSGYPDCRPAFLEAFERLAALATVAGAEDGVRFRVRAPLLELTKAEIIRRGLDLGSRLRPHVVVLRPDPRRPPMRPLRFVHTPTPWIRGGRRARSCASRE